MCTFYNMRDSVLVIPYSREFDQYASLAYYASPNRDHKLHFHHCCSLIWTMHQSPRFVSEALDGDKKISLRLSESLHRPDGPFFPTGGGSSTPLQFSSKMRRKSVQYTLPCYRFSSAPSTAIRATVYTQEPRYLKVILTRLYGLHIRSNLDFTDCSDHFSFAFPTIQTGLFWLFTARGIASFRASFREVIASINMARSASLEEENRFLHRGPRRGAGFVLLGRGLLVPVPALPGQRTTFLLLPGDLDQETGTVCRGR